MNVRLYLSYDIIITVQSFKSHFGMKMLGVCHRYFALLFHNVTQKSVIH